MEFGEKLQKLRKDRGLTQEELAQNLCVSRTAVSKWESGRGYPSIDSIKEIASFFSVTIDELLSSEKVLTLAEKENRRNIQRLVGLLIGILDMFTVMLIVLPLYPHTAGGHIYAVDLLVFSRTSEFGVAYWIFFLLLTAAGILKIVWTQLNIRRGERLVVWCSMGLGVLTVLLLILTRQVYAAMILFALLTIKSILIMQAKELR